ncbi:MAG TPA: MOSC domain-containing protein [Thermoleophilaceae bacterium]|jgi:MOSC domain-containing protein YiiM
MGRVEGIYLSPVEEELPQPVERARVLAGRGPEGDRYHRGDGEPPNEPGAGRDLTLIEAEAIEALAAEHGIELSPAEPRRNVVTRGVGLNDLVGKPFRVGELRCVGVELCEPCRHLEGLTQKGVMRGLVHRGGLRADVVEDGEIAVGDPVEPV